MSSEKPVTGPSEDSKRKFREALDKKNKQNVDRDQARPRGRLGRPRDARSGIAEARVPPQERVGVAEATSTPRSRRDPITWIAFAVAVLAALVCIWALLTAWDAILHGNPTYANSLGATLVGSLAVVWLTWRTRGRRRKRVLRIMLIVLGAAGSP